jgi:hypothetical protein
MTSSHNTPAAGAAADLHALLANFTGTDSYYRHPLCRHVVWTDGVKAFADAAGGYWLLDILATELPPLVKTHGMIFATMTVKDGKAFIGAGRGEGHKNLWERAIDFTDCPEGAWHFWMAEGGPDNTTVIMLPSEY